MGALIANISKLIGGVVGELVGKAIVALPILEPIIVGLGFTPDGFAQKTAEVIVQLITVAVAVYYAPANKPMP